MATAVRALVGAATRAAGARRRGARRALTLVPPLTLGLFLAPIAAGLAGAALPAFGILPGVADGGPSLAPWRALFAEPALPRALALSAGTGAAATLLSFAAVVGLCAGLWGTRGFALLRRSLSPLLSVPHVAVAIGLGFLLAPSGWLVRLVSPGLTGFERPPDWAVAPDPYGATLVFALMVKEVPFLLLMTLSAAGQVRVREGLRLARALGYGAAAAWLKLVLPQIYPQIRLPLYAVLAFSLSVVDMALILGPTTPPPLAVLVLRWYTDPDLALRLQAAAGALLQTGVVAAGLAAWWCGERLAVRFGRRWIAAGARGAGPRAERWVTVAATGSAGVLLGAAALGLAGMALWSIAGTWRFPDALPSRVSLAAWGRALEGMAWPLWNTVSIGLAAALLALVLTLGCLEHEQRAGLTRRTQRGRSLWLLYAPLLVPQVAFLFGAQTLMIGLGADGLWSAVVWSHLLFVLPYTFLSLADPYRALDPRYARSALCLGRSADAVFWRVKLPMLLRPVLVAAAVGFAVSCAQYLATLAIGAGRLPTLTTEAVSLASGGNRRTIGVYVFVQTVLPFLGFALAGAIPALAFRGRRGLAEPH